MTKNRFDQEQKCTDLAAQIGEKLKIRRWFLASAESCTGGWLAKSCVDCVGSSKWFDSSIVSYSYESKSRLLGVDRKLLSERGAVNEATVLSMVKGLLNISQAQIAVAISGIASSTGKATIKPVGTVYFAWGSRDASYRYVEQAHFMGNRSDIRLQSVFYALSGVNQLLDYLR